MPEPIRDNRDRPTAVRISRSASDASSRDHATGEWATLKVVARRYHLHFPGVVYCTTTVILVLGAINGQNNLLFWLFGLAVGGLIVSGFLSGAALMGIELSRELPMAGAVGEESTIRYRIRNKNRLLPVFALTVEELPRPPLSLGPERPTPNWPTKFREIIGYGPYIKPRGQTVVEARVTPHTRGQATFDCVRVWSTFPFGLAKKSVTFGGNAAVGVRPRVIQVDPSLFDQAGGRGDRSSGWRRRSIEGEFYSLREYVPGDSLRAIAWKPSAKRDMPLVRESSLAGGSRVWIVLDARGATGDRAFERAVSVAAGACAAGVMKGLRIGLAAGDGRLLEGARDGSRHVSELFDALAVVQGTSEIGSEDLEPGVRRITPSTVGRDGVVFITAGLTDDASPDSTDALHALGAWHTNQTFVLDAMKPQLGEETTRDSSDGDIAKGMGSSSVGELGIAAKPSFNLAQFDLNAIDPARLWAWSRATVLSTFIPKLDSNQRTNNNNAPLSKDPAKRRGVR